MITRVCTFCNEVKPLTDYGVNTTSRDGYQVRCKKCLAMIAVQRRLMAPRSSDKIRVRKTAVDFMVIDSNELLQSIGADLINQSKADY